MADKIKLTINKVLYETNEKSGYDRMESDNLLKTRIPYSKSSESNGYIWLQKKDMVMNENGSGFMIEIDPDEYYSIYGDMGNPEIEKRAEPLMRIRGDELYEKHYEYKAEFDPSSEAAKIAKENREAIARARANRNKQKEQTNNNVQSKSAASKDNTPGNKSTAVENKINQVRENNINNTSNVKAVESEHKTYTKEQFEEIKRGIRQRVDVKQYSNVNFNPAQMKELRLGLKAGIDVSKYNNELITAEHMKEIRLGHNHGVGLSLDKLNHINYNAAQMKEIRLGLESDVHIAKYLNPEFNALQMKQMRLGLKTGLDISQYASVNFSAAQMQSIRFSLTMQEIATKIKQFFANIRDSIATGINNVMQKFVNNMDMNREAKASINTNELIELKIYEVVEDIKDLLVQAELVEETILDNEEISNNMSEKLEVAVKDIISPEVNLSEEQIDTKINKVSKEIAKEAGANGLNTEYLDQDALDKAIEQELNNLDYMEEMDMEQMNLEMVM